MGSSDGRSHRTYIKNKEILKREAPPFCVICGEEIDLTLHHYDRMSWTAQHIVPLRDCAAMGVDPNSIDNLAPAHRSCNSRGGAEMTNKKRAAPAPAKNSRRWY